MSVKALYNNIGAFVQSGNLTFGNSVFCYNTIGIVLNSYQNDGHGTFSACLINHNTSYGCAATNIVNGMEFIGCQSFFNDWMLVNCNGIAYECGVIDSGNVTFNGGGLNVFRNNHFPNAAPNFIHNGDKSMAYSNDKMDGSSIGTLPSQIIPPPTLSATNLTGVAGLSNGGTGVNLGPNLVPAGAVYDQTVDGGNAGPGYGIALTAGITYLITLPDNGNDDGLTDASADNFYGPAWSSSGTFIVPATGTYYLFAETNATPVLSTVRVFSTNSVVFGADLYANNFFGTVPDADLSGNVQFKNQTLVGPLDVLANGGSENFISGTNTANGSTLSIRRWGTTGYADVNFFTAKTLWFALGISANPNAFPYDKPYLESYLSQYPFYFVGAGRAYGGLYAAPNYGDWVWYNNNVTSDAAEIAANEVFHVHSTNGITDILNAKVGHLIGSFNAPTIVTNSGAGLTSASVSLDASASDAAMTITLNTGTTPAASATIFTVKFGTPYATAPHLSGAPCPMNAAAAMLNGSTMIYVATTTTNLTFTSGTTGLAGASTYKWSLGLIQ